MMNDILEACGIDGFAERINKDAAPIRSCPTIVIRELIP